MTKEKSKQSFYAEDLAWLKETCPYEARSHADRLHWLKNDYGRLADELALADDKWMIE